MTCLYSRCERTLGRTQPLSIRTNTSFCYFSYSTRSNFLAEADIRLGQEHKNSLLCLRRGEGKKERKEETRERQKMLYFVDRASCNDSWYMTNVMYKFLSTYSFLFLTLYMFRAHRAHHQERQIVSI